MNNQNDDYQAILCKKHSFFQTKIIFVATNFLELFGIYNFGIYNKVASRSVTLKEFKCSTTIKIIFLNFFNSLYKFPKNLAKE